MLEYFHEIQLDVLKYAENPHYHVSLHYKYHLSK